MKKRFFIGAVIGIGILISMSSYSQSSDTLKIAVDLQKKGLYKQQYDILSQYRKHHKNDVNADWLYAQAAFYVGKYAEMVSVYESAIASNNEHFYLKLDYAFKLVEIGKIDKAKPRLIAYLPYDSLNPFIYSSLAKIAMWQSKYNDAFWYIKQAQRLSPDNADFKSIEHQISLAVSPWIGIGGEYQKDNQPLSVMQLNIESGKYFSSLIIPDVSINHQLFDTTGNSLSAMQVQIGNTSVVAPAGLQIRMQAGAVLFPDKTVKYSALLGIDKKIYSALKFSASVERKPYLQMLKSLDTSICFAQFHTALSWEKERGFIGQLAYSAQVFDDKNVVSTKSAWFVSPALTLKKISLRCGYGYSFTTSKTDMFNAIAPQSQLMTDVYFNPNVTGQFTPYLTPKKQEVHSLIAVVAYNPFPKLQIRVSGSYGFKAHIDTPYLLGYYNAQSSVTVDRYYYTEKYTTLDVNGTVDYRWNEYFTLTAQYRHNAPNYYYKNDYVAVGLKLILCNEKK